jgi:hypothetical protein
MKRLLICAVPLLVLCSACESTPSSIAPMPTPSPIAPTPTPTPPPDPNATLTVKPANLPRNQTTTIELIVSGLSLSTAALDFGDGTPVYKPALVVGANTFTTLAAVLEHIYGAAGTFTCTLEVTDSAGKTASASTTVVVSDQ